MNQVTYIISTQLFFHSINVLMTKTVKELDIYGRKYFTSNWFHLDLSQTEYGKRKIQSISSEVFQRIFMAVDLLYKFIFDR